MEKWTFNSLLFNKLSDVLEISGAEIARRCGLTQQVLNRYMNNDIVLSVQVLIRVCNALRMPTRYFVSKNNNHAMPDREHATVAADQWHPIEWDKQVVELTFGDGEGRIYWKDVAEAMGVSSQKPHERFLLRKRFPIDAFLTTCNRLGISPFKFLIDLNGDGGKPRDSGRASHTGGDDTFRADLEKLRQKISSLEDSVSELTSKYEALLQAHNKLEHTINVKIDNANGSFIGITTKQ